MAFSVLRNNLRTSRKKIAQRSQFLHDEDLEREFDRLPNSPSLSDYASILRRCRSLSLGKRIHRHISQNRYRNSRFLGNLLVYMYGTCNSIEEACTTFRNIKSRNVFSWNIMLAAYAQNGHLQEASEFFKKVPQRDISTWTTGITMYARDGHMNQVRELFEEIIEPDVSSWNALISGYTQNGQNQESVAVLQRIDIEGVQIETLTLICVLDACEDLKLGYLIHYEAEERDFFRTSITMGTALVTMYGRCESTRDAVEVFARMPRRNDVSWSALASVYAQNGHLECAREVCSRIPYRSTVVSNILISVSLQEGHVEDAKNVFENMPERDVVTWTSMLSAYTRTGRVPEAKCFFDDIPTKNISTWNTLIAAYAQNGHPNEALQSFKYMDLEGVQPDSITFPSVFESCTYTSGLRFGMLVHSLFRESGMQLDEYVGTSLINMYGSCGTLYEAETVFDTMTRRNVVVWNAMVAVYDYNGYGEQALEKFIEMEQEGVFPDSITFITVLAACSHVGEVETGRSVFVTMVGDYGIPPVADHYLCMLDLFGRAGRLPDAEDLLENMPFVPDDVAWTTLMAASCVLGDIRKGSNAVDKATVLEPSDSSFYVLLSNCMNVS